MVYGYLLDNKPQKRYFFDNRLQVTLEAEKTVRVVEGVIAKTVENVSKIVGAAVVNVSELDAKVSKTGGAAVVNVSNADVSNTVAAVVNVSENATARRTLVLGMDVSNATAGGRPLFGFDKGLDPIPAYAPRGRNSTQFQFGGGSGPLQPRDASLSKKRDTHILRARLFEVLVDT